jgi:small subunit ribosomal protein S20
VAARRPQDAGERPERRRLAGAVGTDETDDLARPDAERHIVDGSEVAVGPAEALDSDRHGLLKFGVCVIRLRPEVDLREVVEYVATHASALKAHRQSLKNREHNRQFRSRLRSALKNVRAAIAGNDLASARTALKQSISLIDKMASKGIIHRNAAGRYKSRLTTRLAARS